MTADEWIAAYAAKLGIDPPGQPEIDSILELAATAAHASERIAAPVACHLAALAGKSLDEACALADEV